MADHFYGRDWIRCNTFPYISGFIGITGWSGVAVCDACQVKPAL